MLSLEKDVQEWSIVQNKLFYIQTSLSFLHMGMHAKEIQKILINGIRSKL